MKLRKIITMGLAAIMAISSMSISVFATEQTITNSDDIVVVALGHGEPTQACDVQSSDETNNEALKSLGNTFIVYDKDTCKQLIQLNEYDGVYTDAEVTDNGILLKNADNTMEELVPYYFEVSDLANITAVQYPVYVVWRYEVRFRSSPSTANSDNVIGILDYNTYIRGASGSTADWVYGKVLNNNLVGRVGYVYRTLLNLAPDGNPYE